MSTNLPQNLYIFFSNILIIILITNIQGDDVCHVDSECAPHLPTNRDRYILYDINPSEGFNLRRDVYMRFAILAHNLHKSENNNLKNFKLVLPPWSNLYHWGYDRQSEQIPWGHFFDLDSLKSFAPVIEMYEFFIAINKTYSVVIDEVYVLQHFKDMFETGNFEERMKIEDCSNNYQINYFFYNNVTSHNIKCLSYHGPATRLSDLLNKSESNTFLFHHAEVALHNMFGNKRYWQCRRSMRFNKDLRQIAAKFRRQYLNSTDDRDNTHLPNKWEDEKPGRYAVGGPYLGVHLRRKDFLRARPHQAPSVDKISKQIITLLKELKLTQVFIATDTTKEEYLELVKKIPYKTIKFTPSGDIEMKYKKGGIAIIEQIICSYARYFVGTYESTFSFRIQEEREILGFPIETTFNSFCGSDDNCPRPSVWKIVY